MLVEISGQEAIDLDKMLAYMAAIPDDPIFETDEFMKEVLPEYEEWQVEHLLNLLIKYNPTIVRFTDQMFYMIEPYGRAFISRGGFTKLYKKELDAKNNQQQISKLHFEQLELSVEDLRKKLADYGEMRQLAKNADKNSRTSITLSKQALYISALTLMISVTIILLARYKVWPFDK